MSDSLQKAFKKAVDKKSVPVSIQPMVLQGLDDITAAGDDTEFELIEIGTDAPGLVRLAADISGSMHFEIDNLTRAINRSFELIAQNATTQGFDTLIGVSTFSEYVSELRKLVDIHSITPISTSEIRIGGLTDLYGAIFDGITRIVTDSVVANSVGALKLQRFLVIITDGMPEGHQSHTKDEVKRLIAEFTHLNSAVVLIGLGDKAVYTSFAHELGITDVRTYDPNDPSWEKSFATDLSSAISHHSRQASRNQNFDPGSQPFFVT